MKVKKIFFEIKTVIKDNVSEKSAETRILSVCVIKIPYFTDSTFSRNVCKM